MAARRQGDWQSLDKDANRGLLCFEERNCHRVKNRGVDINSIYTFERIKIYQHDIFYVCFVSLRNLLL
jgi:hypothetical protein